MKSRIVAGSIVLLLMTLGFTCLSTSLRVTRPGSEAVEEMSLEESMDLAVANILDHYLKPPAGREIVIVHDQEKILLAQHFAAGLVERGCRSRDFLVADNLDSSVGAFREVLNDEGVGLIVLASPRMLGGLKLYEKMAFVDNSPSLQCSCSPVFFDTVIPTENLVRLYAVDPTETKDFLADLHSELPEETSIHVSAPGGTDLKFVSRDWKTWPWEIATYPVEASVNGTIVVDGAVFFAEIANPIRLQIREGKLVKIECHQKDDKVCERYVREMNKVIESDPLNGQLAEVGVGGNGEARLCNVLMESESVRGTCHFCFGDSAEFGGKNQTSWHGGTVIVNQPTFYFGEKSVKPGD